MTEWLTDYNWILHNSHEDNICYVVIYCYFRPIIYVYKIYSLDKVKFESATRHLFVWHLPIKLAIFNVQLKCSWWPLDIAICEWLIFSLNLYITTIWTYPFKRSSAFHCVKYVSENTITNVFKSLWELICEHLKH